MKGFYFINTDIRNTRAHTCQILNTVTAINANLPMEIIAPKYHNEIDLEIIKQKHDLQRTPKITFLRNFGIKSSMISTFILFNAPAILFLFLKKIRKEADFIYIRSYFFLPLIIFAYMINIPVFYETHRKSISFSERFHDYIISKMSTGIIVISNHMKEYYLRYKKSILIAHDAVSLQRFAGKVDKKEARKKLGLIQDKNVCVYTGTISKLKGVDYIFAAAHILPEVVFLLVGQISKEFVGVSLPANIKLLGKKDQKELPFILQSADVLLLPHPKSEYSQSPMKLFEYMASSVPIVASRLPSISEVLNDKNAILVEAENASEIANGIRKLINNKKLSEDIAQEALNNVKNYTWDVRGNKIAKFIKNTYESL